MFFVAMPVDGRCTVQFIEWMVETITTSGMTLLLVTHDRAFLEDTCTSILELDEGRGFVHRVGGRGGYARYRQLRAERRKAQAELAQDAKVCTPPLPLHSSTSYDIPGQSLACCTRGFCHTLQVGKSANLGPCVALLVHDVVPITQAPAGVPHSRLAALEVMRLGVSPTPGEYSVPE